MKTNPSEEPAMPGPLTQGTVPPSPSADLNTRILAHLLHYVRDHFGSVAMDRVQQESGVRDLAGPHQWVSLAQFEAVLASARALMRSDEEFVAACAYQLDKVRGPVRFLMGVLSPMDAYEFGAKNMRLISSISEFEPEDRGYGRMFMRYRSTRPESRLMCLSRQAQMIHLPTLWKLPRARVVEKSCIARGDDCCGYLIRVQENRRWLPTLLGGAMGGAGAAALSAAGVLHVSTLWATPLLGVLAGALLMLNRHAKAHRAIADDINEEFLQTARDDVRARQTLFDLALRAQHWSHLMEQQVAGRAIAMQEVSAEIERLRGEVGDESPVSELREAVSTLVSKAKSLPPIEQSAVVELEGNVEKLDSALIQLQRLAMSSANVVSLSPRWLETEPLATELRTRLQALTLSKEVRTSVFAVREAPARVRLDAPLFNRITDALLANAAHSTKRGSIVVEIGGTPGALTIKVSDTGTGMSPDDVQTILSAENPSVLETTERSWVSGMWVVARMLAAIGGRLEVKSALNEGTTFWAHYPIDASFPLSRSSAPPPRPPSHSPPPPDTEPGVLRKAN
ncbi:MAG: sensor histidine kinase [Polyangiaceae bacterium]